MPELLAVQCMRPGLRLAPVGASLPWKPGNLSPQPGCEDFLRRPVRGWRCLFPCAPEIPPRAASHRGSPRIMCPHGRGPLALFRGNPEISHRGQTVRISCGGRYADGAVSSPTHPKSLPAPRPTTDLEPSWSRIAASLPWKPGNLSPRTGSFVVG